MLDLLPGEKLYKQYRIKYDWSQPMEEGDDFQGGWIEGLPAGRHWNGLSHDRMPREDGGPEAMQAEAEEWFKGYRAKKLVGVDVQDLEIKAEVFREEVWCLEWFSHFTWDVGLSDADVLESFQRFVWRTELYNRKHGTQTNPEPFCLMGAEDHWRWFGRKGRGHRDDERTKAPCRCDSCREQGVVRICH